MPGDHHHPPISLARRRAITAGLLLGMSLGALEATVVSTAMPTVISTLGGLAHYSWVFSAYLLTSTASVPIWGRLSDLYGRRRMYLTGVVIFLVGSVMAGASQTMVQLIAARAVQGLGAGAIIPLSMTIVGELYTLAERPRTQALFSGVWGVASIAGPLVGGYITDYLDWRWVFYLNVPFGLLAAGVIASAYPASGRLAEVRVDWRGAALLFTGISALLIALGGDAGGSVLAWVAATVVLLGAFLLVERAAAEPILPLDLFRVTVISRTLVVVFLVGVALFGAIAFIPLFVQAVRGGTATEAGQAITPLFLGWVVMSIVGARATVKLGYRSVAIAGSVMMTAGFIGLTFVDSDSPDWILWISCTVIGSGMGTQMLSLLLAVQHGVERSRLGIATALNQFFRSVGAAVGVAAMGAILSRSLTGVSLPGGADAFAAGGAALSGPVREQFAIALHRVFLSGAFVSAAGLLAAFFLPSVSFERGVPDAAGEQMIQAEMANLEPEDEPVAVPD
jgi:EmrB/QacA subfamily drug resistance transporter